MSQIVALSYFHRKIGPLVYNSYPIGMLDDQLSVRIANIMDQTFNEGFFTHSFEDLYSMNYYFEIHSDWARGNKEMLMVTVILDHQASTEIEQNVSELCSNFTTNLQNNESIFTAFYINDLNNYEEQDRESIIKNDALIKAGVKQLYWKVIENTREKTEEENIATLLKKEHIFKTLEKLSQGPITLELLSEWFTENFPEKNFDEIIETLEENQFIFVNEIGRVEKYILLLKEVNAERIPPDCAIEYIEDKSELIPLWLPIVTDFFSEYETWDEDQLKDDAFTLYQIISDPDKYKILSELRNDLISRDKMLKVVGKDELPALTETLESLKELNVIEELYDEDEIYIVLKTNLQITTSFPAYLNALLPKESKPVVAGSYVSKPVDKQQEEMAEIFKDISDKGETKTKETKISTFLEDLSSKQRKKVNNNNDDTNKKEKDKKDKDDKENNKKGSSLI